jgi:hypothetical protein
MGTGANSGAFYVFFGAPDDVSLFVSSAVTLSMLSIMSE